ncbi:hypothetical protein [uncultured Brachyspira sp.]|uniref:hypothetical protein n=1 Tax=uncultured Brachyspira sp. TaxID=221953 RepID=UPI0025CDC630|nr:hypothetical protein [uncultured Brachyspira sp.]
MRPAISNPPPVDYNSTSTDTSESEDQTRPYVQRATIEMEARKEKHRRLKRALLEKKMNALLNMAKTHERLADDVLDLSSETGHYNIPLRAFHGEWNEVTTLQYALESLQQWIAFGEKVQHIGTFSDSDEPEQQQTKQQQQQKSFFEISDSDEESNN